MWVRIRETDVASSYRVNSAILRIFSFINPNSYWANILLNHCLWFWKSMFQLCVKGSKYLTFNGIFWEILSQYFCDRVKDPASVLHLFFLSSQYFTSARLSINVMTRSEGPGLSLARPCLSTVNSLQLVQCQLKIQVLHYFMS